jgi:hypothetical protein
VNRAWRSWIPTAGLALLGCSEPIFDGSGASDGGADADAMAGNDASAPPEPRPGQDGGGREEVDADAAHKPAPTGDAAAATTSAPAGSDGGDGQVAAASASDGGSIVAPAAPNLPAWSAQLAGDYALQAFTFSEDRRIVIRWRGLSLARIALVDGHYQAQVTGCELVALSASGSSSGDARSPNFPPRRHRVDLIGEQTFNIVPIDVAFGYDTVQPPACAGRFGSSAVKRPFQTWISGDTCRCSGEALPAVDDCRVTDPDGDNRPGYTAMARTIAGTTTIWGINEIRSSFVQGRIGVGRAHSALYQLNEQTVQFGCDGALCSTASTSVDCATEHHPVRFAPLERLVPPPAGWTCTGIVERAATIFPEPPPPFPASCRP